MAAQYPFDSIDWQSMQKTIRMQSVEHISMWDVLVAYVLKLVLMLIVISIRTNNWSCHCIFPGT